MSTELLFVPTTAWKTRIVPRPRPMFVPGQTSPSWLRSIEELQLRLMAAEGLLLPLYLAGYDVDEILLGQGEAAADWVALDIATMRLSRGTTTWTARTGIAHPSAGSLVLAIHVTPLPYDLDDADSESLTLTLDLGDVEIDASSEAWLSVGAAQQANVWVNAHSLREQMLDQLASVLASIHGDDSITDPAGLLGIYDSANWVPVLADDGDNPYAELFQDLTQLSVLLTLGRPLGNTAEAKAFLASQVPSGLERQVWRHWRDLTLGRRISIVEGLDLLGLDEDLRAESAGHVATLHRHGLDADRQSLTMAILHLHERHIIDAIGGYGVNASGDACENALAYARSSSSDPLTAAEIGEMCECLDRGVTPTSHEVAERLVAEYPGLLDEPSRTLIRDTLITLCLVADSRNGELNASSVAQDDHLSSAEHFADLLRRALASAPDDPDHQVDVGLLPHPAVEAHDCWSRWSTTLQPADTLNRTPAGYKMQALIPIAFHDCGNAEVARLAAQSVIAWYGPALLDHWGVTGHHWARPEVRDDFANPYGAALDNVRGWGESLLVAMLGMLKVNATWADIPMLHDGLFQLVGADPLLLFPIEAFEADLAELIATSDDARVQEYTLLLGLMTDYAQASDEATAGRYDARWIGKGIERLEADGAREAMDALRDPALAVLAERTGIEYRTIASWENAVLTSIGSAAFRDFLGLLDAETSAHLESEFVGRVRRVCPAVGVEVVGAFRSIEAAFHSGFLVEPAGGGVAPMSEEQLITAFQEALEALGFPLDSFARQLAKTMKESTKIRDTWLTAIQRAAEADPTERIEFNDAVTAAMRRLLWPTPQARPSAIDVRAFLDDVHANNALSAQLNAELTVLRNTYPAKITRAKDLGQTLSMVTAVFAMHQFVVDGRFGSPPAAISQLRDVVVGVGATAHIGTKIVGAALGDPEYFKNALAMIKAGNDFLSAFSGWISFATNAYQTYVYWLDSDWVGMLLYAGAAAGSAVVVLAATSVIATSPVTALAGFVAAALPLIDIARVYLRTAAEHQRQFLTFAAEPGLFFAPTVALRVPQIGSYEITRAYAVDDEVGEVGVLTGATVDGQWDPTPVFSAGDGVSLVDLAATGEEPLVLTCPHAHLVARSRIVPAVFGQVVAGEAVHEARPASEWWRELTTPNPDLTRIEVVVGQDVVAGAELASNDGTTIFAPGDGEVGSIEQGADPIGFLRVRIYRGIEP